jgi:hypothetical protein
MDKEYILEGLRLIMTEVELRKRFGRPYYKTFQTIYEAAKMLENECKKTTT